MAEQFSNDHEIRREVAQASSRAVMLSQTFAGDPYGRELALFLRKEAEKRRLDSVLSGKEEEAAESAD